MSVGVANGELSTSLWDAAPLQASFGFLANPPPLQLRGLRVFLHWLVKKERIEPAITQQLKS